ncbi:MAG: phosphoribosylformylglycinamidine synthase subunit PurS [Rhodothermales bacterium]|nr:phosphoribosylformylglycinamidine synthase subunit PurS [Rhodothermales bacterium]MCA0269317.1 phosphoribosylformylglycinamidine synthase subunit PurS [Bacteroidota bacterium]
MPQYRARVTVTLRPSILDPQGKAVLHAAEGLGFDGVQSVRVGKVADLNLDAATLSEAVCLAQDLGQKLLANPVMEDFSVDVVEL